MPNNNDDNNSIKTYSCPKCGADISIDQQVLEACGHRVVCPSCQAALQVAGDYAYLPLEGQDFTAEPKEQQAEEQEDATPPPFQPADPDFDPLLADAVQYIKTLSAVSVPQLARYFGTTLERAQLLMQHLEKKGIVGPSRGGAPRAILIDHNPGLPSPLGHHRTLESDQQERAILQELEEQMQQQGGTRRTYSCSCLSVLITAMLIGLIISLLIK